MANGEWITSGRLVLVGIGEELANLPHVMVVSEIAGVGRLEANDVLVCGEPPGALAETLPAGVSLLAVGPVRRSSCRLVIGHGKLAGNEFR